MGTFYSKYLYMWLTGLINSHYLSTLIKKSFLDGTFVFNPLLQRWKPMSLKHPKTWKQTHIFSTTVMMKAPAKTHPQDMQLQERRCSNSQPALWELSKNNKQFTVASSQAHLTTLGQSVLLKSSQWNIYVRISFGSEQTELWHHMLTLHMYWFHISICMRFSWWWF